MLDKPAPVLDSLVLMFDSAGAESCPLIGQGLFQSTAPRLRGVTLRNIRVSDPAPTIFGNIDHLHFDMSVGSPQPLPYLLGPRLAHVILSGSFSFAPQYHNNLVWRHVRRLDVSCPPVPHARLCPWGAWRVVQRLGLADADLESYNAVLDHISGPLRLDAYVTANKSKFVFDFFPANPNPAIDGPVWRKLSGELPRSHEDPNLPRVSAVYLIVAVVTRAERFGKLSLRIAEWDHIVTVVSRLPALTDLRLLLRDGNAFSGYNAVLDVPKLERVILRADFGQSLGQSVLAGDVESFVETRLRNVPNSTHIMKSGNNLYSLS
ncbi:hypothetical protein AURDEDRAFT_160845 [Auricularia subglabra TFB-10046 SS5]|nr:hypothetical protein AURDEDRAFT_160845 [Auricularia subglabra TFB-10046 SS5]